MNVFFVEKNTLYTPPLHGPFFTGITRGSVVQVARDLGLTIEETADSDRCGRGENSEPGRMTEGFRVLIPCGPSWSESEN